MPDAIIRRIREAWNDNSMSHVISESLYDFDLDKRLLRIQDKDFIFVNPGRTSGLSLRGGTHLIKQIRSTAMNVHHHLFRLGPQFSPKSAMAGGQPVKDGVRLRHEKKGGFVNILINVSTIHRFEPGERYRIDVQYTAPLGEMGPFLLFSGAIQPSDYEAARTQLKVDYASKSVTLIVRRAAQFTAYVFEPAKMNYFPTPVTAEYNELGKYYEVRGALNTIMSNFGRAHYFTVAADLKDAAIDENG